MTRAEELQMIEAAIAAGKLRRFDMLETSEATAAMGKGDHSRTLRQKWRPGRPVRQVRTLDDNNASVQDCEDLPSW